MQDMIIKKKKKKPAPTKRIPLNLLTVLFVRIPKMFRTIKLYVQSNIFLSFTTLGRNNHILYIG